ncbi:MAG: DUF3782 domain-containing protein [Deltaproteobacteria bacterium]|nr:DUF3782 domain-containing protein [Deltaproteobacteria bacterium]
METKHPKKHEVKEQQEVYTGHKGQDLNELAENILKVIGEDKQKRATLVGLLVSDVATKQEFTILLAELKAMREDSDKRFEASERRFEAVEAELKAMREDSDKKFEASERRFEAVEAGLKAMREDSDKKFEALEQRFEAIDKRFEQQRQDFQLAIKSSTDFLSRKIDKLGSRWGIMAEDAFREGLSEVLGRAGFSVTKWKKVDKEAKYFPYPREAEIDIVIKNGRHIAIEVKSTVTMDSVDGFGMAVRFYEESEGKKVDEKVIVGVFSYHGVIEYAKQLGIKIVPEIEDIYSAEG